MKNPTRIPFLAARSVGILLLLFSVMHFFGGYPAINEVIKTDGVGEEGARTFREIWIFSSITMALMGAWALFISKPLKNADKSAWQQGALISLGLIFFGSVTQVFHFPNWGMLMFSFVGLILLLPLLLSKKHY